MEQQITIYDENNVVAGTTFRRRAKQLVSKKRAVWVDDAQSTLRLVPAEEEQKEEPELDEALMPDRSNNGRVSSYICEPEGLCEREALHDKDGLYEKENLLRLAKKRVKVRKGLIRHVIIYVVGWPLLAAMLSGGYDYRFNSGVAVGIGLAWGAFLLRDIVSYFYPHFKGRRFFGGHKADPVEKEYKKLKNMEPDRIKMEYGRM